MAEQETFNVYRSVSAQTYPNETLLQPVTKEPIPADDANGAFQKYQDDLGGPAPVGQYHVIKTGEMANFSVTHDIQAEVTPLPAT